MNKRIKKKIKKSIIGHHRCTIKRLRTLMNRVNHLRAGDILTVPIIKPTKKFFFTESKMILWDSMGKDFEVKTSFFPIPLNIEPAKNNMKYDGNYTVYDYNRTILICDLINNIEYVIIPENRTITYAFTDHKCINNFDKIVLSDIKIDKTDPSKTKKCLMGIYEKVYNN